MQPHMRVVYLDHTAKLSGGELALLRLIPHLDQVNAHVILAEDGPLVGRFTDEGISVEVLPLPATAKDVRKDTVRPGLSAIAPALHTVTYALRLARRLRALDPDLVHANSLKSGVYGGIAARLARKPLIWHVRDRIAEDYLPRPAVWGIRWMLRHFASAVIVNSQSTLDSMADQIPSDTLHSIVPSIVQVRRYSPERRSGRFCVGMVGRMAPWKGQDVFLRAFAALVASTDARAVLVGSAMFGEDEYEQSVRQLAVELGVTDRVEFRGYQSNVIGELRRMDVLVHASITAEPFGQVILEGMANGVPVVAADAGGPAEIVTHGTNGMLYPPGDATALAAELRRLADDDALRAGIAASGRQRAADFGPDAVRDVVHGLYRKTIR